MTRLQLRPWQQRTVNGAIVNVGIAVDGPLRGKELKASGELLIAPVAKRPTANERAECAGQMSLAIDVTPGNTSGIDESQTQ